MNYKLKELMETGVFGITSDGSKFVVIGENVVYKDGGFDSVKEYINERCYVHGDITTLVSPCYSFNHLNSCIKRGGNIIYDHKDYEPIEMTIAEIEEKLGIKNLKIKKEGI